MPSAGAPSPEKMCRGLLFDGLRDSYLNLSASSAASNWLLNSKLHVPPTLVHSFSRL